MFEGDARTRQFQNLPTSVNRSCKRSTGLKTHDLFQKVCNVFGIMLCHWIGGADLATRSARISSLGRGKYRICPHNGGKLRI